MLFTLLLNKVGCFNFTVKVKTGTRMLDIDVRQQVSDKVILLVQFDILKARHQWYTGRKESTIWEFDKPKKNKDHPTMKPIPLLAYPILNSSMSNAIVLDPFGGSGSTLIACEQTDRICRTIELDEKFCDVIVKRYIEQVGNADGVSLQRDGLTYRYEEVAGDDAEDIPLF